ncbi:hypothetical protein BEUL_1261 [Bifidobacterium eulemuris]|nr:hypothetical protein BEUL_1261 [Bifidobacterium eulemuris]
MCAVSGCIRPRECGDYCNRHYGQSMYRVPGDVPDGWPCPICGERLGNLSNHMRHHHGIAPSAWYAKHNVTCRERGCDRPVKSRGLCEAHAKLERALRRANK